MQRVAICGFLLRKIAQGHSHQIRFIVCAQESYTEDVWRYAPPKKFWNLGAMRLLSEFRDHFWANKMLFRGQKTEFHIYHCVIHHCMVPAFRSGLLIGWKPHPSQVRLARLIIQLYEQKVTGRKIAEQFCYTVYTVRSHIASFNIVPVCFEVFTKHWC